MNKKLPTEDLKKLVIKDLKKTNYIKIEVEQAWNTAFRETKGVSFDTKKECDVVRKHILNAIKELEDMGLL